MTDMTDPTKLVDPAVDDITVSDEPAPMIKQLDVHANLLNLAVKQSDKQLVCRVLHHLPRFGATLNLDTLAEFSLKYCTSGTKTL